MTYESAYAFRQALLDRIRAEAERGNIPFVRFRQRVVFERFLARLLKVAPGLLWTPT